MKKGNLRTGAVVLAAGYASRMGTCKALLDIKGCSALRRVTGTLKAAGVEDLIAVVGYYREEVEQEVRVCGGRAVFNERYDDGMFSSVTTGISALSKDVDAFFLLPVDIPMVRSATCRALTKAYMRGMEIVYPTFSGARGHPPLISTRLIPEILAWSGEGGLRGLLARHEKRACVLEVPDQGVVIDMDTPEDYELLNIMAEREDIPSEQECLAFHGLFDSPQQVRDHCRVVEQVVVALAENLKSFCPVDIPMLRTAALVHDMARTIPEHAEEAARTLEAWDFPELADLVGYHMDLPEDEPPLSGRSLLYLADKMVAGVNVVGLQRKRRIVVEKFESDPQVLAAANLRLDRARNIAVSFEECTGRNVEDIVGPHMAV